MRFCEHTFYFSTFFLRSVRGWEELVQEIFIFCIPLLVDNLSSSEVSQNGLKE